MFGMRLGKMGFARTKLSVAIGGGGSFTFDGTNDGSVSSSLDSLTSYNPNFRTSLVDTDVVGVVTRNDGSPNKVSATFIPISDATVGTAVSVDAINPNFIDYWGASNSTVAGDLWAVGYDQRNPTVFKCVGFSYGGGSPTFDWNTNVGSSLGGANFGNATMYGTGSAHDSEHIVFFGMTAPAFADYRLYVSLVNVSGAPVEVANSSTTVTNSGTNVFDSCRLSGDTFVVVGASGDTGLPIIHVADVDIAGASVTIGTGVTHNVSGADYNGWASIAKVDDTHFMVMSGNNSTKAIWYGLYSVSGTTPTLVDSHTSTGDTDPRTVENMSLEYVQDNQLVAFWFDNNGGANYRYAEVTVDTGVISEGTIITAPAGMTSGYASLQTLDTGRLLGVGTNGGTDLHAFVIKGS